MNKKTILCIDDEPIILNSLKQELSQYFADSIIIETAESGEEGLEIIDFLREKGDEIVVIISDYIMPQMRGDEFLIEAHRLLPNCMKILLTGQASLEGVTNAINKTNLYRYISKPWSTKDLMMTVESAIDNYHKDKLLKSQNKQIQSSIRYAERIQSSILPSSNYLSDLLPNHFVFYKPKDVVSGDFYWCREEDNKIIIAVADCTGHGVPGAFMSLIGHQLLNRAVVDKKIYSPEKILESINEAMKSVWNREHENSHEGMEIAICVIDKEENTFSFAGAKRPICIIQNSELNYVKGDKLGVDGKERTTYTKHEFEIQENTQIYLYSDGYQDQFGGEDNRRFMSKSLRVLFQKLANEPIKKQQAEIVTTFENWKQNYEQIDDVLILGVAI
ncbi:SpoIIE-like protein with response regulator receiver domain [Bernardetia litoralis DSM 6794]|uniref:SpoIIE-like protein with response regulator receiver domain n=1 Tax=Bernardetia litoralis (strain ATCC 23117 / DSM 6794 / NBRC 15988 / NCIMB 1366 / Fx l1 / Sio-4) TaxID=880071 RepID=I4AIK9_BERLS|nr:SpoIIE family protein phosphatase [Bernardetia litoralis]AFM03794.1 SpoIIE-like protein with response regulator receiver domain [Bernardetia litoralis DSM 6794]